MDVFDLAVIAELVDDVFLRRLLVDVGDKEDPAFDRTLRTVLTARLSRGEKYPQ